MRSNAVSRRASPRITLSASTLHSSLVLVDLDHFKSINDRFGHPFGDAQRLAEGLRIRLASVDMEHEGSPLKITASFGVTATSQFRGHIVTGETMMSAADEALYRAKQRGRDCICSLVGT